MNLECMILLLKQQQNVACSLFHEH